MSQRKVLRRPLRKIAGGDLRDPIIISLKAIAAPIAASAAPAMGFKDLPYVWAKTETKSRKELFAGTQLLGIRTHEFTVRYPDVTEEVTSDHVVVLEGILYHVLTTDNFENRNEWLVISCGEKGPDNLASNY